MEENWWDEEAQRMEAMQKAAHDLGVTVPVDEADLEPPELDDDGGLKVEDAS